MKKTIIISASAVIAILIVILLIVFLTSSYTVTFDLQGGTLEDTTMELSDGDLYQMPIPTKKGFAFDNWYYNGEVFPPTGEWTIEEDITLVARWEYRDENGIAGKKNGHRVHCKSKRSKSVIRSKRGNRHRNRR